MPKKLEKQLVEDYIAQKLQELGWKFVESQELNRDSIREPLLIENLKEAILRINKNLGIGEEELKKVIDELKLLTSEQEGNKKFLHLLKYGIGIKFEKERVVKIINLFDFENWENNEFIFSRQVHFRGKDLIIPDIVLYINGIPLVEIECKSPVDLRADWEQGFYQIKEYEKLVPELYKYLQIGIAFAEKVRYFPIVPWQENVSVYPYTKDFGVGVYVWKKDDLAEDEAIFEMLTHSVLLDILRNFLFIREEHGEVKKVICRYMQYRAVNKIYQRVRDNLKGKNDLPAPLRQAGLPAPRRNQYFVYAILCDNDSIYIGQTDNLSKRWQEHCDGKVSWTTKYKPVEVIHYETFETRDEAIKREKWLKTGFGRKWIKRKLKSGGLQRWNKNLFIHETQIETARQAGKNKGLIWHWQGSGKTLTMIFAAHKLHFDKRLENPTLFIIVDRRDLEEQMKGELVSLKLNFSFETIESARALKEIISHDNFKGKRGVFLTLIHKLRPDERFLPEGLPASISQRKNIVCFLDEVHRSQYGLLAGQMKNVLKNAFFFGFTGTPIAEDERNTYVEFGYPLKEEGYLDKYFLDDSQKDGFTLPLVYLPRLEKEVHVKEEDIKLFIERVESEDLAEVDKEEINERVRKRLNNINVFLENENRIKKIVQDIAEHFKENVDERFKAMVVTGSRNACVLYKKHLDKYLPLEYSEVVMTFNRGDKEPIASFYQEWQKRHKEFPDDELRVRDIVENYKEKGLPKILLVTDMLLTGFDAPILQTMYLDKLLKKHRLLQAIARTNRPYGDVKAVGLIVDYVGILKNINFALKHYYKADIKGGIVDFSVALEEFERSIKELEKIFGGIELKIERKILLKAIDVLRNEETKNDFIENYKKARKLFEALGSLPEKLRYLAQFKWFTVVYEYWKKLTESEEKKEKIEKFFRRTVETIHQNTEIQRIERALRTVALDIKYLSKIQKSSLTQEEKAVNILFALEKLVLVEQRQNPIYRSIMDQLNELIRKWKERKIDYQQLLEEETMLIKLVEDNERKREEFDLTHFDYGILLTLQESLRREENKEKLKKFVEEMENLIREDLIENWQENPTLRQNIERKIREYLLKVKQDYELSYEEFDSLHKKLFSFIKDYGS